MSYKFNPFTGNFDEVGGGTDKFQDLDSDKLEPTDPVRKQIHIGGETGIVDIILPTATAFAASSDGSQGAFVAESYNTTPTAGSGLVGIRGRGTRSSPSGVLANDILFSFGATGISANGTNGFLLGQFGGLAVAAASDATNTTIPMTLSLTSPDGDVIKTYPGRNVFIGSGSVVPSEKLGLRGRLELEGGPAPTQRTSFGKVWYNSSDKKLRFMDEDGINYDLTETGSAVVIDTKENIVTTAPDDPQTAFATDTSEFLLWDGTNWRVASIPLAVQEEAIDSGYTQDNDKNGYGDDYIYGKRAFSFALGDYTDTPLNGAIRVNNSNNPVTYEIYLRNRWYKLIYDLNMDNQELQHTPEVYDIQVWSGNSVELGLNEQPIIQEYQVDAGAYPAPTIIDGGTF